MLLVALSGEALRVVVVTGGPCSGKTSTIDSLEGVTRVPEAATLYHRAGGQLPFSHNQPDRDLLWEAWLVELKISLENAAIARGGLVVCDRGVLDSRAYVDDWPRLLELLDTSQQELEARYDAVVHLDVAPPDAYSLGNAARTESYTQAVALGEQTLASWRGPIPMTRVRNTGSFNDKIRTARSAVLAASKITSHRRGRKVVQVPPSVIIARANRLATAADLDRVYPNSLRALRRIQDARRALVVT
ncbi:hypothetical protein CTAYLR_010789 [Chrysophaeum taylorii]|uniref:NadR/Ttd14 AAA domain-containing protein n=1 Tax=Chrysophaeum taylorii TaxID=2483200 RepID=A0AAD7UH48_9STRA|nr:hypothetical protein CTAYLR_010789 [Chrysophaeum taylorii]